MSAFATHAKTSAFAAGARVLSSQKKTNNKSNNRCERPFPVFVWKYCRLRNLFFYFVWKDRASISNNHFVFGFCASLSLFPPSWCDYCIAHVSHHRAREDDDDTDDACVLFALRLLLFLAFFARACIHSYPRAISSFSLLSFFSWLKRKR